MATEIIHGAPGAYKTSSLISLYVLNALKDNRTIITNIRGFATIEQLNQVFFSPPKKTLFNRNPVQPKQSTSQIILVSHDLDGFQKMARFFHWAPKGALILMDEGQEVYPSRLTKLNEYDLAQHEDPEWPRTVENAFNKHRHFGWDIYISTTNIAKVHKEIRQVAEYAFRHRNLAGLTGFKGRFKRVQHDPEVSGKTLSHVLSTTYNKMDVRVFGLYGSTTTDTVKDIANDNQIFKSPKFIIVMLLFCASLLLLFYVLFVVGNPLSPKTSSSTSSSTSSTSNKASPKESFTVSSGNANDRSFVESDIALELFHSVLYYSGHIHSHGPSGVVSYSLFESSKGQISDKILSDFDIDVVGYGSAFLLTYGDLQRFIPSGDPNPTHEHFDYPDQSVSTSNANSSPQFNYPL